MDYFSKILQNHIFIQHPFSWWNRKHLLPLSFSVFEMDFLFLRHIASSFLSWHIDVFLWCLPVEFPFTTFPFCLYLVQILDTANWKQPTSFATFSDDWLLKKFYNHLLCFHQYLTFAPWCVKFGAKAHQGEWALFFNCTLTVRFNMMQMFKSCKLQ